MFLQTPRRGLRACSEDPKPPIAPNVHTRQPHRTLRSHPGVSDVELALKGIRDNLTGRTGPIRVSAVYPIL